MKKQSTKALAFILTCVLMLNLSISTVFAAQPEDLQTGGDLASEPEEPQVGDNTASEPEEPQVGDNTASEPEEPQVGDNTASEPEEPQVGGDLANEPKEPVIDPLNGVTSTKDLTVAYQDKSASVTDTYTFSYKDRKGTGSFTIQENAQGNLVVVMNLFGAAGQGTYENYGQTAPTEDTFVAMPGDVYTFNLGFVNHSANTYTYKPGSLVVAPGAYGNDGSNARGFDGQNLYDGRKVVPGNKIVDKDAYLAMDYQQRVDCILNYVNTTLDKNYTDLSQLTATEMRQITGYQTADEYDDVMSEFVYNTLFNYLVGVSFDGQNPVTANGSANDADTVVYSVGNYMRSTAATQAVGEAIFATAFAGLTPGATANVDGVTIAINGPMTTNLWAGYDFTGYMAFELEQVKTEPTTGDLAVTKVDKATQQPILNNGASFHLYQQEGEANLYYTGVEDALWSPKQTDAAVLKTADADGMITVLSLQPGQYFLQETIAPTGYVLETAPITVQVTAGQTTALTVSNTKITTTPDEPDEPDGPDEPNEPDEPNKPVIPQPPEITIPETDPPQGNLPEVTIPEEQVPTASAPEVEDTVIIDTEVPLGNLPFTGVTGQNQIGFSIVVLAITVAAVVLGYVCFQTRKKSD